MLNLFPSVEKVNKIIGDYNFNKPIKYLFLEKKVNVFINFDKNVEFLETNSVEKADVIYKLNSAIASQNYYIKIDEKVNIEYGDAAGAFYATQTLVHYIKVSENSYSIPKMEIFDGPKTKVRGFMLDISRNKVAKVLEIKKLIDLMTQLKMNHLELYVEGFSFEYKSFAKYLEKDGYISVDEYLELEKYANERFIDLVPNQNGFGHMADWLEKDEFKDLAVCPGGINLWGRLREPSTLNPLNEGSIELVKKMYKDMLTISNSKYFNMNFDEPFELGHGLTEGMNREDLYLDYMNKAYEEVKKYNKIPLMWGDVLVRHDDKWDRIPKDMIFIDWGYDANYSFAKHAEKLHEKNVAFMCAPGTCSWSSFFGRYIDWYENIKNAVDAVYDYKGEGVILTDWGDFGHLQFWNVSLAPIIFMGMYSWNHKEGTILNVRDALNEYLYKSSQNEGILADIIIDLSNYYRFDTGYSSNGTKSFYRFMWASVAPSDAKKTGVSPYEYYVSKIGLNALPLKKYEILEKFFDSKLEELKYVDVCNDEIKLVCEEIKQTIKLLRIINHFSVAINDYMSLEEKTKYLDYCLECKDEYLANQEKVWLSRNKFGGFTKSKKRLTDFFETIADVKLFLMKRGKQ